MNKRESEKRARTRVYPETALPLVSCEGTAHECGVMLGATWREALRLEAGRFECEKPWWKDRRFGKEMARYASHLPDLYRGMADGAGLDEDQLGSRASRDDGACTSFAIAPSATLDGRPISGQTKDVAFKRGLQFVVLRVKIAEGPSMMSLTYPGWLFGHGFVKGGTAIFRNSLYVTDRDEGMPYDVWGMLALHCPTVDDVMDLVKRHGVRRAFHATVADEHGGILGIENGKGGPRFLKPRHGIYAHANCVISGKSMQRYECEQKRRDSLIRTERLQARLQADRGRLTPQLAYGAICDHGGYPTSVCRHQSLSIMTGGYVIVEPTRGLVHASRGHPCMNWPRTYRL